MSCFLLQTIFKNNKKKQSSGKAYYVCHRQQHVVSWQINYAHINAEPRVKENLHYPANVHTDSKNVFKNNVTKGGET